MCEVTFYAFNPTTFPFRSRLKSINSQSTYFHGKYIFLFSVAYLAIPIGHCVSCPPSVILVLCCNVAVFILLHVRMLYICCLLIVLVDYQQTYCNVSLNAEHC